MMTPREIVLAQINHEETPLIPYRLIMEGCVAERVEAHYGNRDWHAWLSPYLLGVEGADQVQAERVDASYYRDAFGSLWRDDARPVAFIRRPCRR